MDGVTAYITREIRLGLTNAALEEAEQASEQRAHGSPHGLACMCQPHHSVMASRNIPHQNSHTTAQLPQHATYFLTTTNLPCKTITLLAKGTLY